MLINFSVENWESFNNPITFSMVAGREKQHRERIAEIDKFKINILPVAAIYGGNASGKTKFFNALSFAKNFITKITQPDYAIPRKYFKLDNTNAKRPSSFVFEILTMGDCFEFRFSVTDSDVIEEKLTKILTTSEKILYHRTVNNQINFFDKNLKKDPRLQFVAQGTRNNQLFLTNSISQNFDYFKSIYNWFKDNLILIGPDSYFMALNHFFQNKEINNFLEKLDTGISKVDEIDIPFENLAISEKLKTKLLEELPERAITAIDQERQIYISKQQGSLSAKRLVTYHKTSDNEDVPFEFKDESQGTQRLMHLLPCFCDLWEQKKEAIYVIDELDRCLHTLLTKNLIENYLQSCSSKTRSQLLFTTHDVLLMDQDLLRRDEIWVTERDQNGNSSLVSFSEYKEVRADKDIRKSYLEGRLGGIPKILLRYRKKQ